LTGWSRRDTLIRTGKNPTTIQQGFDMTNSLTENEMLDLLDETGYQTEYFENDPNLLREYASNEGYLQRDDGLFYKVSDKK
jgi:hypothetical protein